MIYKFVNRKMIYRKNGNNDLKNNLSIIYTYIYIYINEKVIKVTYASNQ